MPARSSEAGSPLIPRLWLIALVLLVASACGPAASAQPVRQIETSFERDVNRFRWTSDAQFGVSLSGWELWVTNRFRSDAFILFDDRLSFRDENRLGWQLSRPINDRVSARVQGQTFWFSQSRVFSQEVYGGVRIRARDFAWLEPAVGAAWDRRPGIALPEEPVPIRMEVGPAYGVQLSLAPPSAGEYRIQLEGRGAWQVITPRRGRSVVLEGIAERRFEETRLVSSIHVASFRRDAYQAVSFLNRTGTGDGLSETIEATTSDTLEVGLELDAPFSQGFRFTGRFDVAAYNRFIRTEQAPEEALFFETDFRRRGLDSEVGLGYEREQVTARLAVRAGVEAERRRLANREQLPPAEAVQKSNLLQQADYDEGTLALIGSLRATPHRRLVLSFNGSSRIIRHDTPEANADDRDEVYHTGEAGLRMYLSRYLWADVKLFGSYYHTVYLQAERSAENNVQRSLRLLPALYWSPSPRTDIRLSTEIRATYTVDDFVLPGRRPMDQSARELRYEVDVSRELDGGFRLMANGSFSDLRLGRLLWNEFAEIPFDTLRTYSGWVHVQARPFGRITAEAGIRFFIRSDFDQTVTVRYPLGGSVPPGDDGTATVQQTSITRPGRVWIEQVGPTAAIIWPIGRGASALRLEGWLNVQHVRRRLYGPLPEARAERIRRAGREGTRSVMPNLAMSVMWRF